MDHDSLLTPPVLTLLALVTPYQPPFTKRTPQRPRTMNRHDYLYGALASPLPSTSPTREYNGQSNGHIKPSL